MSKEKEEEAKAEAKNGSACSYRKKKDSKTNSTHKEMYSDNSQKNTAQPYSQTDKTSNHVVAGDISGAQRARRARSSADGFYHFNTLSGDALSAQVKPSSVCIYGESGNAARVTSADVNLSNGVIHVVDSVLLPR